MHSSSFDDISDAFDLKVKQKKKLLSRDNFNSDITEKEDEYSEKQLKYVRGYYKSFSKNAIK